MPNATEEFLRLLNLGSVFVNYVGHGSPTVWAQEKLLVADRDMGRIDISKGMPLWIAGTCNWGQYDDPMQVCMAENLLTAQKAIGIIASSRPSYAGSNTDFIQKFLTNLFPNETTASEQIGIAFYNAKTAGKINDEKYHLFSDPAMKLATPQYEIMPNTLTQDTISALSQATVSGSLEGIENRFFEPTIVTTSVFDGKIQDTVYYETGSLNYTFHGNRLFSGNCETTFANQTENFSTSFFVPKDIAYSTNAGKIHFYAHNENLQMDAAGMIEPIYFLGTNSTNSDNNGPTIEFLQENRRLSNGYRLNNSSELTIRISDEYGINLTNEIGHGIILEIDENSTEQQNLTDLFTYDLNSYQQGSLALKLAFLDEGEHQLSVKAWDSFNNATIAKINLHIMEIGELIVSDLFNFPNPMQANTKFYFHTNMTISISIHIYSVSGTAIAHITPSEPFAAGYNYLEWDGRDAFGAELANGIYLFTFHATSTENDATSILTGKIAIAN